MNLTRPALRRMLACCLLLSLPATALADGTIERIAPPAWERGKTTTVTVSGKNLDGAEQLWVSLPEGSVRSKAVESRPDRAVFEVTVSANAPVGTFGVRVATKHGLSNVHLQLIDDLPVSRGSPGTALKLPASVWGTFREAEIDRYSFDATAGQELSFEAVASRFGKDADPLVTVRDARGTIVAERDNDPGLYYDSRFAVRFAEAGRYTVEIRDSRYRGPEQYHYVLRIGKFPAGRAAVPAAVGTGRTLISLPEVPKATFEVTRPNLVGPFFAELKRPGDDGSGWVPLTTADSAITIYQSNGTPAAVPGLLCGVLRVPNERQTFRIELAKGRSIQIRGEAKALNSPADLELAVLDGAGKTLRRSNGEPTLEFTAPSAGPYLLSVHDQLRDGGDAFAYRIAVSDSVPMQVTAAVEGLTVPLGSWQPVPLALVRGGAKGPIRLKLLDAPDGLTLTPDVFDEKETAIVARLSASGKTPLGVRTLQILAESADGQSALVRTLPLIDRQIINVDLIPLALREDQTRLPSSVEDRFGLQIVPPAPFEVELPEPLVALARYQQASVPVKATRVPEYAGPIRFRAAGGQLGSKDEGRTRVYAEFPEATRGAGAIAGTIQSKILSNLAKNRIEVTATGEHAGRRISLVRTFDLNLTTAFALACEPAKLALLPGESGRVRVTLSRMKTFDGPVTVALPKYTGAELPETITFAKGQAAVDVNVVVLSNASPGRQSPQALATATVSGFEEELRAGLFELEIRALETPKKKP